MGLWLSAINVRYRDVGFLTQIWMFGNLPSLILSACSSRTSNVFLYSLNPMAGVIEGFRWALLGKQSPDFVVIAVSSVMLFALIVAAGLVYFKYTEQTFADVI